MDWSKNEAPYGFISPAICKRPELMGVNYAGGDLKVNFVAGTRVLVDASGYFKLGEIFM